MIFTDDYQNFLIDRDGIIVAKVPRIVEEKWPGIKDRIHDAAQQDGAWQPIETFPQDGEAYLAADGRVLGGFPQVVYWDDGRLHVSDASISYAPGAFTHWKAIDPPPAT